MAPVGVASTSGSSSSCRCSDDAIPVDSTCRCKALAPETKTEDICEITAASPLRGPSMEVRKCDAESQCRPASSAAIRSRDRYDFSAPATSSSREHHYAPYVGPAGGARHIPSFLEVVPRGPSPSLGFSSGPLSGFSGQLKGNSGSLSPWANPTILCRTVSGNIMQCAAISLPSPSSSCSTDSSSSFSVVDQRDWAAVQKELGNFDFSSEESALRALDIYGRTRNDQGPVRIMVAVDQHQECRDALDWALNNVIKTHRLLCLVHVLAPEIVVEHGVELDCIDMDVATGFLEEEVRLIRERAEAKRNEERRAAACKMLAKMQEEIITKHDLDVETYLLEGEVAPLLVQMVDQLKPEKLIMGRCKRSNLQRVLGGNGISDQCIRRARSGTSVLAIRRRKKAGGYSVTSKGKRDFWLLA